MSPSEIRFRDISANLSALEGAAGGVASQLPPLQRTAVNLIFGEFIESQRGLLFAAELYDQQIRNLAERVSIMEQRYGELLSIVRRMQSERP